MAREVLLDSSIYIEWDRSGPGIIPGLLYFVESYDPILCETVCCEVGRGLRSPKLRAQIKAFWSTLPSVPTDKRIWEEAEELLWQLGRQGHVLPLPDAVIACCAKRIDAVLYTHDRHFDLVPDLKVARSLKDL